MPRRAKAREQEVHEEFVETYLDCLELPADQARVTFAHVRSCSRCQALVSEYEAVSARLARRTAKNFPVPVSVDSRLQRDLTSGRTPGAWIKASVSLPVVLVGALAAVAMMAGYLTSSPVRRDASSPPSAQGHHAPLPPGRIFYEEPR